uniref:Receptor expression-enhancing protein n=1 Tax=Hemiselmis tepida TaxID=464990 RepID=A0A7S0Z3J5_9CRYP|mmetsp:Transcript_7007/g.17809  ORF Transcript_7007/g.17809 Transcript_7007/m.17809 type:complete len:195 (+) Transcript_7007:298-882(+)
MIPAAVSRVICILVGHVYPLYRTFKACNVPDGAASIDGKKLVALRRVLAFWAVHGSFTFAEYFVDWLVWWLPMYYEAKILFLLWLVYGHFEGAVWIFDNLIVEALNQHQGDIDASLERSRDAMRKGSGKLMGYLFENGASLAAEAIRKSQSMVMEGVASGGKPSDSGRFEELPEDEASTEHSSKHKARDAKKSQ